MNGSDVLTEAFDRIRELVHDHDDLGTDDLTGAPAPGANSIGWLLWHTTRVQDAHVAELMDVPQEWEDAQHAAALGREPDPGDTGYGHSPTQAAGVRVIDLDALLAYHDAVADRTLGFLASLDDDDLDRVVDEGYDPPVTAGARLVSVVQDSMEHLGQAAYARGLLAH